MLLSLIIELFYFTVADPLKSLAKEHFVQKSSRNNFLSAAYRKALIGGKLLLVGTITLLWHLKVVTVELAMIFLACYEPMDCIAKESDRCESTSNITQKV